MPIYEYRCAHCEHQVEILQKINDSEATTCPDCGKDSLIKLVSAAAFKLKGTGWYETDFKGKKSQKESNSASDKKTDDKKPSDTSANKIDDHKDAGKKARDRQNPPPVTRGHE